MDETTAPVRVLSDEVSRLTGLPVRTILSMSVRGEIPGAAKLGRRWSYDRQKVVEWIKERENDVAQRASGKRNQSYRPQFVIAPTGGVNPLQRAIAEKLGRIKK